MQVTYKVQSDSGDKETVIAEHEDLDTSSRMSGFRSSKAGLIIEAWTHSGKDITGYRALTRPCSFLIDGKWYKEISGGQEVL